MIKPYQLTREIRYIGLPLGFGFLGGTYAFSAFIYSQECSFGLDILYVQLIVRTFGFIFLSMTYYFSSKTAQENTRSWNAAFLLLGILFLILILVGSTTSIALTSYQTASFCARILNLFLIIYVCAHTLRSYIQAPSSGTLLIPFGYIFFAISQYALIIFAIDYSMVAFFSGLAIRWVGLAIFLFVAYRVFYTKKRRG